MIVDGPNNGPKSVGDLVQSKRKTIHNFGVNYHEMEDVAGGDPGEFSLKAVWSSNYFFGLRREMGRNGARRSKRGGG